MFKSTTEFKLPNLGLCSSDICLEDSGVATIKVVVNRNTPEESASELKIPEGLLRTIWFGVDRLHSMERQRKGLPSEEDDDEDDF